MEIKGEIKSGTVRIVEIKSGPVRIVEIKSGTVEPLK